MREEAIRGSNTNRQNTDHNKKYRIAGTPYESRQFCIFCFIMIFLAVFYSASICATVAKTVARPSCEKMAYTT